MTDRPNNPPRLTRDKLLDFAGEVYFGRGEDYFQRKKVSSLDGDDACIRGLVKGTRNYQVMLQPEDDGGVTWSCSCPLGDRGDFCKHAVALGLAWLSRNALEGDAPPPGQPDDGMQAIKRHLAKTPKDVLIGLLMDQAVEDQRLFHRLLIKAQRSRAGGMDVAAVKKQLRSAIAGRRFLEYGDMPAYVQGVDDMVSELKDIFSEGHADGCLTLCEYGLKLAETAMTRVDDSDGMLGNAMWELEELHLACCRQLRPDPEKLAAKLFKWEMATDWDTFHDAVEKYEELLGQRGVSQYYALAKKAWDALPNLGPDDGMKTFEDKRSRLTSIMEGLAKVSGGLAELVEVKAKNLSAPHRYLDIVHLYRDAGQGDMALKWAEDGYRVFKDDVQVQVLTTFLIKEYTKLGRHQEAMDLAWKDFDDSPSLGHYRVLHEAAQAAGSWAAWRDKALARAHKHCAKQKDIWSPGNSLLVRIFLWEEDVPSALAQAKQGGCQQDLWLDLAGALKAQSPGQAADIYRSLVEPAISRGNNQAYAEALQYMQQAKALWARAGREGEFTGLVSKVRAEFKRKRNMMKLMAGQGW